MTKWQPIETAPDRPMDVLFYIARFVFRDYQTGAPVAVPDRERYEIGYWDGQEWCEQGTNHFVFEFDSRPGDDDKPTHWMPLPEPPE